MMLGEILNSFKRTKLSALAIVFLLLNMSCQPAERTASPKVVANNSQVLAARDAPTATAVVAPTVTVPVATATTTPTIVLVPTATSVPTATPSPTATLLPTVTKVVSPTPTTKPLPRPTVGQSETARVGVSAPHAVSSSGSSSGLMKVIRDTLQGKDGTYGVAIKNLTTGESAAVNGDQQFEAASLYKLPVMYEAFKQWHEGELSLTEEITVSEKDATGYNDGEPTMEVGSTVTASDAIQV